MLTPSLGLLLLVKLCTQETVLRDRDGFQERWWRLRDTCQTHRRPNSTQTCRPSQTTLATDRDSPPASDDGTEDGPPPGGNDTRTEEPEPDQHTPPPETADTETQQPDTEPTTADQYRSIQDRPPS